MAESPQQKSRSSLRIILFILILIILVAGGTYLYAGWLGYQESPKLVEVDAPGTSSAENYTLSSDQESSQLAYGDPEGFTILFYEEETPTQGIQTVRLETWEYYSLGLGLTFINGELIAEDPIQWEDQAPVVPSPYSPAQFSAFMTLADVIASADLETYIEVPLNKELIDQGTLYYGESLSFGLQDDQLVYVEALAYIEE